MEFHSFTTLRPSPPCSYPPSSPLLSYKCSFRRRRRLNFRRSKLSSLRITATAARNINGAADVDCEVNRDEFWGNSEFVEVIGIGSRNDAVFDFCMESPFQFSSLRFWNIVIKDSMKAQLQRRIVGKDVAPIVFEAPMASNSCAKAVILVASAGYGLDLTTAIDILKAIRSANGFVVTIIMKPFSFEGQRRQDEAKNLIEKFQEHTNLLISLDTDMLLKKDLVTLDEAVKTANNAVLMAITAVYVLTSDIHRKFIVASHYEVKRIEVSEVMQVLERYKEAKIGFGAGYNIETSILRSMYDCPFLTVGVKDLDGMILCIVASSGAIEDSDVQEILRTLRQTTEYEGEILISAIREPSLEPNLLVTTVFILGFAEKQVSQKSSILSGLAHHFPFIFNLFSKHQPQTNDTQKNRALQNALPKETDSPDYNELANINAVDDKSKDFNNYSEEPQTGTNNNYNEFHISSGSEQAGIESSDLYDPIVKETHVFQRQPLASWNFGNEHQIAKDWGKEMGGEDGATLMLDNLSIFCLPVGVKSPEELKDNVSFPTQKSGKNKDDVKVQPVVNVSTSSWSSMNDTSLEAVKEFYNTASALVKGKDAEIHKQRNISVRAASMLEAERDSPKKWSPVVEMQYRGGIYKGRCQGGLPEGKGRLVLGDGSIYDGMWRYGKRSGLGTFYFSNGDAFQGSWRDDVIHGKGWLYFHTGDRWFANFWKGKANGESRFYSESGDVFFGNFQDGWRHGQFICIDVDGRRFIENWDQGVIVSRKLDSDNGDG
ncbi:protein ACCUMULATION AND REPLICATION OF CHLOROPLASTS 3, chloroplastic [Argentina anserina]|uniref:protein ACCUMULATION AND REPLICATION OF CHLOROPLASTS 3, chloroplastic n=1 Tax=Argentina anserina TaxID=57926 RepID=UPI00217691A8|nr:protein ACCUMULATION AND REPLICATION OF CHLOROPLASTS 3, chloroplastic [Potentilla anserina]